MYKNLYRLLKLPKSRQWAPLLACSLTSVAYFLMQPSRVRLEDAQPVPSKLPKIPKSFKDIKQKQICDSKQIKQGRIYLTEIETQNENDEKYTVVIGRVQGKLFAVSGFCTYHDPLDPQKKITSNDFKEAMLFGNKLLCPHHGCAFCIETGTVEFGPAYNNLARFFVEEKEGKVILSYPSKLPKGVRPKTQIRDLNDMKKVLILGNDHNATMGCIHGLKLYEYGGQINVMHTDEEYSLPYRKDLLHKMVPNFKNYLSNHKLTNSEFENLLESKVYSKLQYHAQDWYKIHGIQFHHANQYFRLINKRYYPYVKFLDGSKIQFDGMLIAQGTIPRVEKIEDVTISRNKQQLYQTDEIKLASNVFMPYYNKKEHTRLLTFLNKFDVKEMLIFGLNPESLQFVEQLHKNFPQIKINVFDFEREHKLSDIYGPDISNQILKQYTKEGINFYVQITEMLDIKNNTRIGAAFNPQGLQKEIEVRLDSVNTVKGDGMVYFPNQYNGNTERIKDSKYVDFDYDKKNDRVITDPFSRTDTKRIFAAGGCSSIEFFATQDRISLINPLVEYEQGFISALNIMALKIPFHYIPIEIRKFMGKSVYYAGARKLYDQMYIMGDVNSWDFIAFYAFDTDIVAISASPSRQKEFQVLRECFRLQCLPDFKDLVAGQWTVPKLYKLIRKINKSGCYRDEIHGLDETMNIPDVIWMQRDKGSFANENKKLSEDDSPIELDRRGYVTQV